MSENFQFYPRPDAHPMEWNELLPPLQHAVRDLLVRLEGAVSKVDQIRENSNNGKSQDYPASCFLVYGERGTGKTTVLLSAKDAVGKPHRPFFKDPIKKEMDHERKLLRKDAKRSADELQRKGLVWLEVLDIESMPLHTNLLTTLLTRVRNALYASDAENKSFEHASILEDSADSARHKLNKLINDATFMWEEIHEPNTRDISSRQIYAADISANYKKLFKDAMEALSKELGRRNGSSEVFHPIVLPIDNIDRSTTHLLNIVRLAQLVASPYLWLVLAGDREDIETFLERAYWKELITIGDGAGGNGKLGLSGEDEAFVMARRQAAAASHKLLPPSHRIEIKLVEPIDTLKFMATLSGKRSHQSQEQTIYDLLKKVIIPGSTTSNKHNIRFVELFDARKFVEEQADDAVIDTMLIGMVNTTEKLDIQFVEFIEEHQYSENLSMTDKDIASLKAEHLTIIAQLALQLPAREVVDLWQLAYWTVNDKNAGEIHSKVQKMARTMLRNIIAESKVSNKVSQLLQNKIITRNSDGTTILNFCDPNPKLHVQHMRAWDAELRVNKDISENLIRSLLRIRGKNELVVFSLVPKNKEFEEGDELPASVAGWLAVLHDIVRWSDKSWILDCTIFKLDLVKVSHTVIFPCQHQRHPLNERSWPVPNWNKFLDFEIFSQRWDKFRLTIRRQCGDNQSSYPGKYLPWILAIGWVACVLDTFWILSPFGCKSVLKAERLMAKEFKPETWVETWTIESLLEKEKRVMDDATTLYPQITFNNTDHEKVVFNGDEVIFMRDWLEQKLPLLLSYLYVPMEGDIKEHRYKNIINSFNGTELVKHWESFFLADIEKEFKDMFKSSKKESTSQQELYLKYLELLGPFANKHTLWLNPNLDGR
jgi:hypothetical protein